METMKTVLAISGSDPSGGAGMEMDLKVISAFDLHGLSAATSLTVQDTRGVKSVNAVSSKLLTDRINTICNDIAIDAIKIGALASSANIKAVAAFNQRHDFQHTIPIVCDPVIRPTH